MACAPDPLISLGSRQLPRRGEEGPTSISRRATPPHPIWSNCARPKTSGSYHPPEALNAPRNLSGPLIEELIAEV